VGTAETALLPSFTQDTSVVITEGVWNFTVMGYKADALVLQGKLTDQLISPESHSLTFSLEPLLDGLGSIAITLILPSGSGVTTAAVFKEGVEQQASFTLASNQLSYSAADIAAGDYYYSFRLKDSAGITLAVVSEIVQIRARLSSEKTITLTQADFNTPPNTPTAPIIEAGDGQITVSWAAVPMVGDYEVYWGTASTPPDAPARTVSNTTTTVISGLTNGATYYVWVKAKNAAGTSGLSLAASGTPLARLETSIIITLAPQTDVDGPGQSAVIVRGASRDFQVTGSYPSYQWYLDGSAISDATAASYTLNTAAMLLGAYELSVVVITDVGGRLSGRCSISVEDLFVTVPGATVIGSGDAGVFVSGRTVTVASFAIAKYETTYELWYEVRVWAEANGYTFANQGRNGYEGTTNHPVTEVSWRDVIVWCNAYSEKSGRVPVYTYQGAVIKSSLDGTACDNAVMDKTKSGFRLPTEVEWEFAARGGDPSDTTNWNYIYAGSDTVGDVVWYEDNSGHTTHPVGTKAANSAGLYDMSGNVFEWCWDWFEFDVISGSTPVDGATSGSGRVARGGSWFNDASYAVVSYRLSVDPDNASSDVGFRVVCPPSS
jgi:formylglycine-generating enzyme required for sulfatase activity